MKEATGELNLTVITIVAIAAIAGLFYIFVWPSISNSIKLNTACSDPYTSHNGITCSGDPMSCSLDGGGESRVCRKETN